MNENETIRDLPDDSGQSSQRTIADKDLQRPSASPPETQQLEPSNLGDDPHTIAEAGLKELTKVDQSLRTVAGAREVTAVPSGRTRKKKPVQGTPTRFKVLRDHAKGGLGKVSVALDQELNREVALKEILSQYSDDTYARERFVLEAEITGGLEHPGIVPVYGLGQSDDGCPYYAMRFIKGDSLKQAIDEFHRKHDSAKVNSSERLLALRQLLDRFIDVCNAMEYAHSRGILHRDLKPANIMVGKYGETLVVDWGLAKAIGDRDIGSDQPLRPLSVLSGYAQTMQGSAVGTPAYMSPEQAAGKLNELGFATDIYSLGATLYHILCGRPPFEKQKVDAMLQNVQRGAFERPRIRNPEVPRGLEAICLKGMALKPEDRYPTARAMADDVAHWLADEPVSAATDTVSERAARWGRKHKGLVQAGSVSLMLIALISSIAYGIVSASNRRLDDANSKIVEQNKQLNVARNAAEESAIVARQQEQIAIQQAAIAAKAAKEEQRQAELAQKNAVVAEHERMVAQEQRDYAIKQEQRARELVLEASRSDFATAQMRLSEEKPREALAYLGRALRYDAGNTNARDALWMTLRYRPLARSALPRFLLRHQDVVFCANFNADGSRVITASADQTAQVWNVRTGDRIGIPLKHDGPVNFAEFSRDGRLVLTVSADQRVQIWEVETGLPKGKSLSSPDQVYVATFSPDGSHFLTATGGGVAQVWDCATTDPVGSPLRHQDAVYAASFSPDGSLLVTASGDTTALIWDISTSIPTIAPLRHQGAVYSCSFSPDGSRVITASSDTTARVWDVKSGQPLFPSLNHDRSVSTARFSPDGSRVITASDDKTARIWNARTGEPLTAPLKHDGPVISAQFSTDGTRVITVSDDRWARIWNARTGLQLGDAFPHVAGANITAFSPDGTLALSASDEHSVAIWNVRYGTPPVPVLAHQDAVYSAEFSPDGRHIVTASGDATARIWDVSTSQPIGRPLIHERSITVARFRQDGARIITASDDSTARIWNAMTGEPVVDPFPHGGVVVDANFSHDGKWAVTASHDGTARLWSADTGRSVGAVMKHEGFVSSARFSPSDQFVVTASRDKTSRIWDATSGEPIASPLLHDDAVYSAEFSPDGSQILTASRDKTARVWDARSGQPIGSPLQHEDAVYLAGFAPTGDRLFTVCEDRVLRIWDLKTGQMIAATRTLDDRINSAVFNSHGSQILTSHEERVARIWDGVTAQPIGVPLLHESSLNSASFSPDGSQVVTATDDKTARLWDVRSSEALEGQIAELITAVTSGLRLGRRSGVLESATLDERLIGRDSLRSSLDPNSDWSILLEAVVDPLPDSRISPRSSATFRQTASSLIRSKSLQAIVQAMNLDPGNPLLQIGLAGTSEYALQRDFLREYGVKRLPPDETVCRDAAAMLLDQGDLGSAALALDAAFRSEADHSATIQLMQQVVEKADSLPADAAIQPAIDQLRKRIAPEK